MRIETAIDCFSDVKKNGSCRANTFENFTKSNLYYVVVHLLQEASHSIAYHIGANEITLL